VCLIYVQRKSLNQPPSAPAVGLAARWAKGTCRSVVAQDIAHVDEGQLPLGINVLSNLQPVDSADRWHVWGPKREQKRPVNGSAGPSAPWR